MLSKKNINKLLSLFVLVGLALFGYVDKENTQSYSNKEVKQDSITEAYYSKKSDLQVRGSGKVIKLLKDDTKGHKHQKFILNLESGISILIAHNIDLAPRINNLKIGDIVEFYGEYEYNLKGGIVHWTHHDPNKRHIDGWLRYFGDIYQ